MVLARHSARLGAGGAALEEAVKVALWGKEDQPGCWGFLLSPQKMAEYRDERRNFEKIYKSPGQKHQADERVRNLLGSELIAGQPAIPRYPPPIIPKGWNRLAADHSEASRGIMELPTHEVRFAHDTQSEIFAHNHERGSKRTLLQLVVELLVGSTPPESVPMFDVCKHNGHWYCRSGNRRLAAMRLAQRFWPERFGYIRVKAVATDKIFLHGAPDRGKRPKLTTHQNGANCEGQWMFIHETGESVGHSVEYMGWQTVRASGCSSTRLASPWATASSTWAGKL